MKDFDKIIGRNAITMIYFFTSQCIIAKFICTDCKIQMCIFS